MPPITLDISPSLQNIRQRVDGNGLFDAIQKGRAAGFQNAQQQNALSVIARANEARPLAGAALNGVPGALEQLNRVDPVMGNQVAQQTGQDYKTLWDRLGGAVYATKTPEDMAKVQQWAQANNLPHADELTWQNRENLIAEHQSIQGQMEQRNSDRSFQLQKGGQDIQQKMLENNIANSNRTYNLEVGRANQNASRYSLPPIDPKTGSPVSDLPPPTSAGSPAYPGADGITKADQGGVFTPGGGNSPPSQQPIPQPQQPPQINGFPAVVAGKPLTSKYGGTPLYPNAIVAANANGMMSGDLPPDDKRLGTYASQTKAALAATGYDFTKANEDWQAIQKNISVQNGPKMLQQRASIDQLEESIPLARQLAQQWQKMGLSGQFPKWNQITISAAMNGLAGPEAQKVATQLASQINHMSPELAMIYKGGSAATDAAMAKADTQLKADWSLPQLMSALDLVEQNMVYRRNSLKQAAVGAGGQPIVTPGSTQPAPTAAGQLQDPLGIRQ